MPTGACGPGAPPQDLGALQRRLRESEERCRLFVEHALDAIWCLESPLPIDLALPPAEQARQWRLTGRVAEGNAAFVQRVGAASGDDLRGRPIAELGRHWLARAPSDTFERLAASRYAPQDRIAVEVDGAGGTRHLRVGLFGDVGVDAVDRVWFVEQDITRQIDEGRELRESRDLYEAVIRTALDGIVILDDGLHLVDCNEACERMLGAPREALLGLDARRLIVLDEGEELEPFVAVLRSAGGWRGRVGVRPLDGGRREVELSVRHTPTSGGRFYCFAQDVTAEVLAREAERRREAQMAHIARLSTLGEMASGIAHELNQPLGAIVNYATGVARRLRARGEADEELLGAIDQVGNQARRAGGIIQRMRAFAHKSDQGVVRCSLNQIVEDTVGFLGLTDAGRRVRVALELGARPDEVLADPILVEQVLVNLLRNAEDALEAAPPAGRRERPPRIAIRTLLAEDPGFLEVQVEDDGPGIAPAAADHLFAPFFTTKPEGLGLGLSISASIVRAHGGRLWVTSAAAGGACFHFTLAVPCSTMSP